MWSGYQSRKWNTGWLPQHSRYFFLFLCEDVFRYLLELPHGVPRNKWNINLFWTKCLDQHYVSNGKKMLFHWWAWILHYISSTAKFYVTNTKVTQACLGVHVHRILYYFSDNSILFIPNSNDEVPKETADIGSLDLVLAVAVFIDHILCLCVWNKEALSWLHTCLA